MAMLTPSSPQSGTAGDDHRRQKPWSALTALIALAMVMTACSASSESSGDDEGVVSDGPIRYSRDFLLNCSNEMTAGCIGRSAAKGTVIEFPSGVTLTYRDSGVSVEPLDQGPLDTTLRFQATFEVENQSGQALDWSQLGSIFYLTFDTDAGREDPTYDVPDLLADGERFDLVATYGLRTNSAIGPSRWDIAVRNTDSATIVALHADDATLEGFKSGDITEAENAAAPMTSAVATSAATTVAPTTTTNPPTTTTSAPVTTPSTVPTSTTGAPTTSTTASDSGSTQAAPSSPGEQISVFVEKLVELYDQGDAAEMAASLHPVHQEFWAIDECIAATQSWVARDDWGMDRISGIAFLGPERIDVGGGRILQAEETYLVTYQQPGLGERQMRVSLEPGGPYWFSNCEPVSP